MTAVADLLPLTETITPDSQAALAAAVAGAYKQGTTVYPLGGGTSLDFGLPATRPGIGLSLAGLNRVIDYPARDMTITVEAGITLAKLSEVLAAERQWLPIDAPRPDVATLGGLIATNFSGVRRYGYGTLRDYVIGISAVDGRGVPFKAGGRVVKNVAGYDFCKLLTGSLGTLGVITQVRLKVKPRPEASAFVTCDLRDWGQAEPLLISLVKSATTPSAIELLVGPDWHDNAALGTQTAGSLGRLAVGLEGTADEVQWMVGQLAREWNALGITPSRTIEGAGAAAMWNDLRDFSASESPLVFKFSVLPGRTVVLLMSLLAMTPSVSLQSHAGNGIVIARYAEFDPGDVSKMIIGKLHPAAHLAEGSGVVLSSTLAGLTRPAVWGSSTEAVPWMNKVKRQFDPKNLLNPGRFVYDNL